MKFKERLYTWAQIFNTYHKSRVRQDLTTIVSLSTSRPVRLLDVGARRSNYTTGLFADVVLMDIPQESDVQAKLDLGVRETLDKQVMQQRTNVTDYIIEDFLTNSLPDACFDIVAAIEVIEHIEDDYQFVLQAHRVLKPGGVFYLTTPNGRVIPKNNPDHIRHYTDETLGNLLNSHFEEVQVLNGEIDSRLRRLGRGFWKPTKPHRLIIGMAANVVTRIENRVRPRTPTNTARLFAKARKSTIRETTSIFP